MDIEHSLVSALLCLERPKKLCVEFVRDTWIPAHWEIHSLFFYSEEGNGPQKWLVQLLEPFVPKEAGFYVGFLTKDEKGVQICKVEGVSKIRLQDQEYPYGSVAVVKMFPVALLSVKEVELHEPWD